jgi:hypothetical protein
MFPYLEELSEYEISRDIPFLYTFTQRLVY